MQYEDIITSQRQFFDQNETLSLAFRIEQLKKLKTVILKYQQDIVNALKKDLGKSELDVWTTEIAYTIQDINLALKNIKKWQKPMKVATPVYLLWGRSEIHRVPYGVALIIGAWNFPFVLTLQPLIGCIAAGNCAIVKPSEVSSHSQELIIRMINDHFPQNYIAAIKADGEQTQNLLKNKFDYIFFTGGVTIGKYIMEAAAKHLTPVTLELGGKNPCIVADSANLNLGAKSIVWAKFMNSGQVCLAPDYLLVHQSSKNELIDKLKKVIREFYEENPEKSSSYGRIINEKHFDRLLRLLQKGRILFGGQYNKEKLYLAPTLIEQISLKDPIMQEEIFGPILPIFTYDQIEEIIPLIKKMPQPLALYLFTKNKNEEKKIINQLAFGGGCINDCLYHTVNPNLPFGGIGQSGMGAYHGKYSFETFSYRKSIYKKIDYLPSVSLYPPYTERKFKWFKKIFNVFFK